MKNTPPPIAVRASQREALEARVGLRLAGRLSEASQQLPHDVTERLRVARERAVELARTRRLAQSSVVLGGAGGAAALAGAPSPWLRLASLMPLFLLMAGLLLIQQYHDQQQIAVAAEIDTALLSDELPPAAYGDPGFAEFLRSGDEQ